MQILEVTLGAEETRPGPMQYSTDKKSAFVKLAVHPGDKLDDVLAAGREALARALGEAKPTPAPATVAPAAPVAPPEPRKSWLVTISNAKGPINMPLRQLGFTWREEEKFFYRHFADEAAADKAIESARLMNSTFTINKKAPEA